MHYFLLDKIENDNPQDFTSAKLAASIRKPFLKSYLDSSKYLNLLNDTVLKKDGGVNIDISHP